MQQEKSIEDLRTVILSDSYRSQNALKLFHHSVEEIVEQALRPVRIDFLHVRVVRPSIVGRGLCESQKLFSRDLLRRAPHHRPR